MSPLAGSRAERARNQHRVAAGAQTVLDKAQIAQQVVAASITFGGRGFAALKSG